MATPADIKATTDAIGNLPERIDLCERVARTLLEVGKPLEHVPVLMHPSDYQRARRRVQQGCEQALMLVRRVRRDTISPDLIRSEAAVEAVAACCAECPTCNRTRIARGEGFECQVRVAAATGGRPSIRFVLSPEGAVHER